MRKRHFRFQFSKSRHQRDDRGGASAGKNHRADWTLISAMFGLLIFGLFALWSATAILGWHKFEDSAYFFKHQLLQGIVPGLVAMAIAWRIPYGAWRKWATVGIGVSVLLLIAVLLPGLRVDYGTAHSWLNIAGLSFQPAELAKLALIIFLAWRLELLGPEGVRTWHPGVTTVMGWLGLFAVLLMLQPDLGTTAIFGVISLTMFFAAGARWTHLAVIGVGAATVLMLLIAIAPYRLARLTTFLHPERDPQGQGYQLQQAMVAIGSGGWFGRGLGMSRQKFSYLPEVASDSIYAVIAEELGFLVSSGLILLLAFVVWRILKIAKQAPDPFGRLLGVGIAAWFGGQALFNIGAMLGLLPLTGLPLPLVSYGGTATLFILASFGIVFNLSMQTTGDGRKAKHL